MASASVIENINEYLAVYPDASYRVYLSKEQALNIKPLFVAKALIHSAYPIGDEPNRKKYSFKIVDSEDKPYNINCVGWQIVSIIKYYYRDTHTEIRIADPEGEIREFDTCDDVSLESIANLLLFINQFKGYKDWSYYELKQENVKLRNENQELKDELAQKG